MGVPQERWVAGLMLSTLALLVGCTAPGTTQSGAVVPANPRTIAVRGEGVVRVPPQAFQLVAAVWARDMEVDKAVRRVVDAGREISAAVQTYPIDRGRTRIDAFTVAPEHDREGTFLGYDASQSTVVIMADTSQAQKLTAAVLKAGANRVSIDFVTHENRQELVERAKLEAVRDARRQAERMAAELGVRLGRPIKIGNPDWYGSGRGGGLFGQGQNQDAVDEHHDSDELEIEWLGPESIEIHASVLVIFEME